MAYYLFNINILFSFLLIILSWHFPIVDGKKNGDVFDKVSKETGFGAVFLNTIETGKMIRQCGCDEQDKCFDNIRIQVYSCSGKCWEIFRKVTPTPDALKKCFDKKESKITAFLKCFHRKSDSCVPDNSTKKMIQKHNIAKMLNIAEEQITTRKGDLMKSAAIKQIKNVFNTTLEYASCLKQCMLKENHNGFCFDKIDCQPHLTERKTITTIKKCLKEFDWKDELAETCDCCIKAGISELKKICPMLKLMAGGSKKSRIESKPPSSTVAKMN
uniref:CPG4 domain-containing protein n=1 Tax=Parastrongyloides trichosuri TaxID=131310 RepID=A0A0N5A480_PARTI